MASVTTVSIPTKPLSYPIVVGANTLAHAGAFVTQQQPRAKKALVICDATIAQRYLGTLAQSIQQQGLQVYTEIIQGSEANKTLDTVENLYDVALACNIKRSDVIIALGGGITGDLTGYFAATYLRGVPFIQVPTTLLAQVDASVGGKVAINWRNLKNLIGAFYQPVGVLIDTETLETLPPRIYRCGMAEVIKYGLLEQSVPGWKPERSLLSMLQSGARGPMMDMGVIITRCCEIKAAVVQADPEERQGIREMLNLGHTFGHAYETLSEGRIPHGEAVAMGMVNAFDLSASMGMIDSKAVQLVKDLLEAYGLPIAPPIRFAPEDVLEIMRHDKKTTQQGMLRLVLPREIPGLVKIQDNMPEAMVLPVL